MFGYLFLGLMMFLGTVIAAQTSLIVYWRNRALKSEGEKPLPPPVARYWNGRMWEASTYRARELHA